jgi:hypothetical protein
VRDWRSQRSFLAEAFLQSHLLPLGDSGAVFALLGGLKAAAKAEGATTLTLVAEKVTSELAETLVKMGEENAAGEVTGFWIKVFNLQ